MSIQLAISLAPDGTPQLKSLSGQLQTFGNTAEKESKKANRGFRMAAGGAQMLKNALIGMGVVGGIAGITQGMKSLVGSGIKFNAELESVETQFKVILGSASKAKKVMGEIVEFSAKTPFQLQEVARAGKMLEAFGLSGIENLELVGDAAAAAGKPIEEIALVMGRIKSGAFGEAFMRLAETGLATKDMLKNLGLEFDKAGSFKGSAEKALNAVKHIFSTRFGGMMAEMSETWEGATSTMKDNWNIFRGALMQRTFEVLKPQIKATTEWLQHMVATGRVNAWGEAIGRGVVRILQVGKATKATFTLAKTVVENFVKTFAAFGLRIFDDWTAVGHAIWETIKAAFSPDILTAFWNASKEAAKGVADDWRLAADVIFSALRGDLVAAGAAVSLMAKRIGPKIVEQFEGISFSGVGEAWADTLNDAFFTSLGLGPALEQYRAALAEIATMKLDLGGAGGGDREDAPPSPMEAVVDRDRELAELQKELWKGAYGDIANTAESLLGDTFDGIMEKTTSTRDIIEGLGKSLKRAMAKMAAEAIASAAKTAIVEGIIRQKAAAAEQAAGAARVGAAEASEFSSAGAAAAGYHLAYSGIPFAGPGLALGAIAKMTASIAAAKAATAAFRTGGYIYGGGSGNEDNQQVNVSGGEYVLRKSAVDAVGVSVLDAINRGQGVGGGGGASLVVNISGGGITEDDIEEEVVPVLERLAQRRRFKL